MAALSTSTSTLEGPHAWARRLAARRHAAAAARSRETNFDLAAARDALWAIFDSAYQEAATALAEQGDPGCIAVLGEATQRTYRTFDQVGAARLINVRTQLAEVNGQLHGGAFISNGRSRLSIFLMPAIERGRVRWQVARTGRPFTNALVHDLFLSEFGDDPEATLRLSPLSGQDLWD